MRTRNLVIAAAVSSLIALAAGDLFAAGNGRGGFGKRNGNAVQIQQQTNASARPAGSQRRDGTFLTTGTTANGSTVRPSNGKGLQDGSRLTTPTTVPAAQ